MSRLSDIPRDALPEDDRRFHDAVKAIRRRPVSGPFIVLMNSSPDLAARFAHLGHYFHSRGQADEAPLPVRARAFVSLVGSRALDAPYEWAAWIDTVREAGISQETIDAVREGKAPRLDAEEELIARVCTQLVSGDHRIDAATFDAALARYGAQQLVELVATLGYFAMIALPLNAFEIAMTPKQIALRKPFAPLEVHGTPYAPDAADERALPPLDGITAPAARVPLLAGHDDVAPESQHFLDRIVRTRGHLSPVFQVLLHSPDAAERIANVGAFFLFESALPPAVKAVVWLIAAREFDCGYTWRAGVEAARAAGVDDALIAGLEHGRRPGAAELQSTFDFCRQLMRGNHHVDDETYRAVVARYGIPVTVQIAATLGYVIMMSLMANAFEVPLPEAGLSPML